MSDKIKRSKLNLFIPTLFFSLIGYSIYGQTAVEKAGLSEIGLERYSNFIKTEISEGRVAGAVSLIYRKGQVAQNTAFGHSQMKKKDLMTEDKIFYIQSMTKPIISVAFMTLYEQGHFLLTDPVSKYIPAFEDLMVLSDPSDIESNLEKPNSPVLIWHLLSHTAGFSHGLGQSDYEKKLAALLYQKPHKSIAERVDALLSHPLMGHPGAQWNYSAATDVLAVLIEHFSGQTVEDYLNEYIFTPLGMNDTGYNVPEENSERIAGLHALQEDGTLQSIDQWSPSSGNTVFGGTHGLYSTAADYLKFGQMLLNMGSYNGKRIVGRKTLELMTDNHIEGLKYSSGNGFGLGFGIRTDVSDVRLPGSEGAYYWSGAFNTYFLIDPKEKMIAILMTQSWPYTNYYGTKMRQMVYSAIDD